MKKLTDYQGAEAIELWANLLEPFSTILAHPEAQKALRDENRTPLSIAQAMLRVSPEAVVQIMQTIDDTPVDGVNAVVRILDVLLEIMNNKDFSAFFGFAVTGETESASSGSATANTEAQ